MTEGGAFAKKRVGCRNSRPLTIACHMKRGISLFCQKSCPGVSLCLSSIDQKYDGEERCRNPVWLFFITPKTGIIRANPLLH